MTARGLAATRSLVRARREHRALGALLVRADVTWSARTGAGRAARRAALPAVLRTCAARLGAHLAEEERAVYPLLRERLPEETGALDVALGGHATLRDLVGLLEQRRVELEERGDPDAEAALGAVLHDLVDLWRLHARRVDRVIGPLLRRLDGEGPARG